MTQRPSPDKHEFSRRRLETVREESDFIRRAARILSDRERGSKYLARHWLATLMADGCLPSIRQAACMALLNPAGDQHERVLHLGV